MRGWPRGKGMNPFDMTFESLVNYWTNGLSDEARNWVFPITTQGYATATFARERNYRDDASQSAKCARKLHKLRTQDMDSRPRQG